VTAEGLELSGEIQELHQTSRTGESANVVAIRYCTSYS